MTHAANLFTFATCRQRAVRERMSALRTNDLEAYARLVCAAKSDRLTELLGQTDACLGTLAARLHCSLRRAILPAASLKHTAPGMAPEGTAAAPHHAQGTKNGVTYLSMALAMLVP